jgi:hypothetical protein
MAEVQVSNIQEDKERYDAFAQTDDVFPNMVDHVEIIIRSGDKAGKVTYTGDAALARSVFPVVMATLDDAVLAAATKAQQESIFWSSFDVELTES